MWRRSALTRSRPSNLVTEAAQRFGGIVAPTMTYHIHETGYHAPWLDAVMGRGEPAPRRVAAAYCAGKLALSTSRVPQCWGSAPLSSSPVTTQISRICGWATDIFAAQFPIEHFVRSDPELVQGQFNGDHAGRYELSQLLAIRPELVAMDRAGRIATDALGRFAQNPRCRRGECRGRPCHHGSVGRRHRSRRGELHARTRPRQTSFQWPL